MSQWDLICCEESSRHVFVSILIFIRVLWKQTIDVMSFNYLNEEQINQILFEN